MNPKDLLSQLTRLEHTLNDFSFEELTAAEASRLKKSFQNFRVTLEDKILTPSNTFGSTESIEVEDDSTTDDTSKNNIQAPEANQLVARVSHEIRTPLNAIIGVSDLLSETKLNKEQKKYISIFKQISSSLIYQSAGNRQVSGTTY